VFPTFVKDELARHTPTRFVACDIMLYCARPSKLLPIELKP
jgi:hypothetical protein